ncbi:MAG: hypothetical protein EPN57_20400 [Paraburkholderia sp.]|nr:MAG: hypothetical protein EPN57_20400 [Paraburkholderia sp.]
MKDIALLAHDAGLTVLLNGKIGREEYRSVSGSFAALQRFAEAYYEPAGDTAKLVEKLHNRAALQFEDEDAQVMREAGTDIKTKAEDEQAVVLHWFITLVLKHGANWWNVARTELTEMQKRITGADARGDTESTA